MAISKEIFHREIAPERKSIAGEVVHYAFGTLVGAGYAHCVYEVSTGIVRRALRKSYLAG